jgi:hypothetical protein
MADAPKVNTPKVNTDAAPKPSKSTWKTIKNNTRTGVKALGKSIGSGTRAVKNTLRHPYTSAKSGAAYVKNTASAAWSTLKSRLPSRTLAGTRVPNFNASTAGSNPLTAKHKQLYSNVGRIKGVYRTTTRDVGAGGKASTFLARYRPGGVISTRHAANALKHTRKKIARLRKLVADPNVDEYKKKEITAKLAELRKRNSRIQKVYAQHLKNGPQKELAMRQLSNSVNMKMELKQIRGGIGKRIKRRFTSRLESSAPEIEELKEKQRVARDYAATGGDARIVRFETASDFFKASSSAKTDSEKIREVAEKMKISPDEAKKILADARYIDELKQLRDKAIIHNVHYMPDIAVIKGLTVSDMQNPARKPVVDAAVGRLIKLDQAQFAQMLEQSQVSRQQLQELEQQILQYASKVPGAALKAEAIRAYISRYSAYTRDDTTMRESVV